MSDDGVAGGRGFVVVVLLLLVRKSSHSCRPGTCRVRAPGLGNIASHGQGHAPFPRSKLDLLAHCARRRHGHYKRLDSRCKTDCAAASSPRQADLLVERACLPRCNQRPPHAPATVRRL